MLKLRRIELQGFKSFYDRSEIVVNGGVTALVGPNGCGKSNVSDAVAWVLGEQNVRSLRGNTMQDIIFNGTGKRSPLGMAEVTISLVDDAPPHSNGGPPPGPVELTVQRRLYRSGESQYLLNGRPCRLRDIQDIFLGTGLGPNHYAIIEQGRIGQILSAKPTQRRMLIEEAAGITRFRARRKLAESRLEAARGNLSRVNDILAEVERQRNSLKRQAGKARRYREVRGRLREVLAAIFSTRAEILIAGQERVAASLANIDAEGKALEAKIADLEARVHRCRSEVEAKENQIQETREQDVKTTLELETTVQRIQHLEERVRSLEERAREFIAEKDHVLRDIERRDSEIVAVEVKLESLKKSLIRQKDDLAVSQSELDEFSDRRRQEESAIDRLRDRRFDVIGKEAELGNSLTGNEELLRRLNSQSGRIREEEGEARLALEGSRAKLQAIEIEQASRRLQMGRLVLDRDAAEQQLSGLRSELEDSQAAVVDARSLEQATRHRLETIRELSLDRAYGTESVQQFFNHVREQDWAPVGILADFVEVPPDYEATIEDLLHGELQYVVVESLDHAEKALGVVRGTSHGRLDVLVLDDNVPPAPNTESIEGATPVADLVRLDDRVRFFARHLEDAYIVGDMDSAWELSNRYPNKTFVARSGEVVRNRVIGWGERTRHGPLSLKREMRELDRRAQSARKAFEAAARRASELAARVTGLEEKSTDMAARIQESEKEAMGLDHGVRSLVDELERTRRRVRDAEAEAARLSDECRELETTMALARIGLEEIRTEKAAIDQELQVRGQSSIQFREAAEKQAAAVAELGSRLAVTEERKETLVRDLAGLQAQAEELQTRRLRIEEQIEAAASQKSDAVRSISEDKNLRESLTHKRAALQVTIESSIAEAGQLRQNLNLAESAWDEARQEHDFWKDRSNTLQIERTEIESELNHLVSLCRSELRESIESVCLDSFETLTESELEEHEGEYRELRQKLDSIGNVNMMAVEEYEEAAERFEFLTGQRQDLLDSIRDTNQAIEEIDAVCRKQFAEAFADINTKFSESFADLFGGGHGELRLIEPAEGADGADASDAGIEIVSQPPGKKLQNVLLLSGGEKALTALSLLIALFRYKPSPFCMLDEVDAPLDDANVERFARMVHAMSRETQFIVITHCKRTMETASQLYGVTMEEAGVSKVVSVRLN